MDPIQHASRWRDACPDLADWFDGQAHLLLHLAHHGLGNMLALFDFTAREAELGRCSHHRRTFDDQQVAIANDHSNRCLSLSRFNGGGVQRWVLSLAALDRDITAATIRDHPSIRSPAMVFPRRLNFARYPLQSQISTNRLIRQGHVKSGRYYRPQNRPRNRGKQREKRTGSPRRTGEINRWTPKSPE